MIKISLTNEEAAWLRKQMNKVLDDAHWGNHGHYPDEDSVRHARDIFKQLDKEITAMEW